MKVLMEVLIRNLKVCIYEWKGSEINVQIGERCITIGIDT